MKFGTILIDHLQLEYKYIGAGKGFKLFKGPGKRGTIETFKVSNRRIKSNFMSGFWTIKV